jgi:hypothetical protein
VAGYYLKSRPDSRALRGDVTWVVTPSGAREEVEHQIRSRGYRIAAKKAFPGVFVLKAVHPLA